MSRDPLASKRTGNLLRVIHIGVCFMLVLTANSAAQNLMSHIFTHLGFENLTQICMSVQYFIFILASPSACYWVTKISSKTGLVLGAIGFALYVSGGALATYCDKYVEEENVIYCTEGFIKAYNISAVFLQALFGSIFWVCQGVYVNKCADEQTRGMYNGIFLALMQSSQLWSGLVAALVLKYTDEFTFYLVLLGIMALAVFLIALIMKPLSYRTAEEEQENQENQEVFAKGVFSYIKLFVTDTMMNKKYNFLFLSMVFSGIVVGFFPNYLGTTIGLTIKHLPSNIVESRIGFVFTFLAIGEILAGLIIGKVSDKVNKIYILCGAIILGEVALAITFLSVFISSYEVSVVSGFLWGFCDNNTQIIINIIIGSIFNSKPELFACLGMYQAMGSIVISGVLILFPKVDALIFIGFIGAFIVFVQIGLHCSLSRKEKAKASANPQDAEKASLVNVNVKDVEDGSYISVETTNT